MRRCSGTRRALMTWYRRRAPDADASVMVRIDAAIGAQSTERLSLWSWAGGLALGTRPAELKKQSEAIYRTGPGQRIVDFAAGMPAG